MTGAMELMARQLEGGLPFPSDVILIILKWVKELNRQLLAYFKRKALPSFSQLFRVSLDSYQFEACRDWGRSLQRVSDEQPVQLLEETLNGIRKMFTPIGVAKSFYGPGY